MKSFHDWMQCQVYESHLKNLIKIKQTPSKIKKQAQKSNNLSKSICVHRRPFSISSLGRKNKKIHPAFITNEKREQMIQKQNISFAQRILKTSAVISMHSQVDSYRKLHSVIKRAPSRRKQQNYKQMRLKSFMRTKEEGTHSQTIKIILFRLPKNYQKVSKIFWFKLILENQRIQSHIEANQILLQKIIFPLKNPLLSDKGTLKIYCYKGLDYQDLGCYKITIPNFGQKIQIQQTSQKDPKKHIKAIISTQKIPPKKKNIKQYR